MIFRHEFIIVHTNTLHVETGVLVSAITTVKWPVGLSVGAVKPFSEIIDNTATWSWAKGSQGTHLFDNALPATDFICL